MNYKKKIWKKIRYSGLSIYTLKYCFINVPKVEKKIINSYRFRGLEIKRLKSAKSAEIFCIIGSQIYQQSIRNIPCKMKASFVIRCNQNHEINIINSKIGRREASKFFR